MTLTEFRGLVTKHFSSEELKTLCFDLKIDFDSLSGEGHSAQVREFIAYMIRHGRVKELSDVLSKLRPQIPWPALQFLDTALLTEESLDDPELSPAYEQTVLLQDPNNVKEIEKKGDEKYSIQIQGNVQGLVQGDKNQVSISFDSH
jgi:hypothetical protein